MRDGVQYQFPPQGALSECHPRPMYSPPPLRRASLPVYPPPASNPAPPFISTPPLFLDALEGGSTAAVSSSSSCLPPLQTDGRSAPLAGGETLGGGGAVLLHDWSQHVEQRGLTGGQRVGSRLEKVR